MESQLSSQPQRQDPAITLTVAESWLAIGALGPASLMMIGLLSFPVTSGLDRLWAIPVYEDPGFTTIVGPSFAALAVCGVTALLLSFSERISQGITTAPLLMGALIGWAVLATAVSEAVQRGFLQFFFGTLTLGLVWWWVAWRVGARPELIRRVLWGVLLSVALPTLFRMLRDLARSGSLLGSEYVRSHIGVYAFGPAVLYSQALVIAIPLSLGLLVTAVRPAERWAAGSAGALLTLELLLTNTRGALLGLVIALLFYAGTDSKARAFVMKAVPSLAIGLLLVAGPAIATAWTSRPILGSEDVSGLIRLSVVSQYLDALWRSSLATIVIGRGITGEFYLVGMRVGPHNSWISVLIDLGIVGAGLLLGLVVVSIRGALRGRETVGSIAVALAASMVAWVIHSMTTGNEFLYYVPPILNIYTFVLLGFGARLGSPPARDPGRIKEVLSAGSERTEAM